MAKNNKSTLKSTIILKFVAKRPEYGFAYSSPTIDSKLLLFSRTVKKVEPKLIGVDFHITAGMKICDTKKERFCGAYSRVSRKTISSNDENKLAKILISEVEILHKTLENEYEKYKLGKAKLINSI